jgi:hypothetical protein
MHWIPSCSWGRPSVMIDGLNENHTSREKLQWKKRWASFSTVPHLEQ